MRKNKGGEWERSKGCQLPLPDHVGEKGVRVPLEKQYEPIIHGHNKKV